MSSCYGCHKLPSSDFKKHNSGHEWFLSLQILNIFQIVIDRVCDASIRSMLEEFQTLNFIFRLYYEYHLDLCNDLNLNCLSDFLKTSNLSKAILWECLKYRCCLIPNTDGLVDSLRQPSWWEGKRRGRLDMGYESWGQKLQCEMLEYFEVARDIDIIHGRTLTAWRNMRCLTRGWSSKMTSIFIPVELRSSLQKYQFIRWNCFKIWLNWFMIGLAPDLEETVWFLTRLEKVQSCWQSVL